MTDATDERSAPPPDDGDEVVDDMNDVLRAVRSRNRVPADFFTTTDGDAAAAE